MTGRKNSDWPTGSRQRIATDHVRVPSPMIGQYKLDSRTNSICDTGQLYVELNQTANKLGQVREPSRPNYM